MDNFLLCDQGLWNHSLGSITLEPELESYLLFSCGWDEAATESLDTLSATQAFRSAPLPDFDPTARAAFIHLLHILWGTVSGPQFLVIC